MAYLVQEHFSHGTRIPQYWQPDNAPHVMPCETEADANEMEEEIFEMTKE